MQCEPKHILHQQQPYFPTETHGCSGRLCWLWQNLVPSDGEIHATRRIAHIPPVLFGDVYAQSERHVCYTLRSGCSYAEAVYTTPGFFGNAAGAPGNHSYYLLFNNFQNLCIQFVFSSMYLCIYIATYLHTVYLDWQHAVFVSNSRCAWRWRSSERPPSLPQHVRTPAVTH